MLQKAAHTCSVSSQDSNVAGGDDINRNLKSFAARRTDIFGDQEVAIGEVVGKSAEQANYCPTVA